MRGTILHAPAGFRVEDRPDPVISEPTDAIIRTVATCVCGSDLWPHRGCPHCRAEFPFSCVNQAARELAAEAYAAMDERRAIKALLRP